MNRIRPAATLLGLVVLGAAGALGVAALLGLEAPELARLGRLLVPATLATVAVALIASRLLRRTSLGQRYLAIAAIGTIVALGNLAALTRAMFVSPHAATILAVVLTYATAAGLATAFSTARSSAAALRRVTGTAEEIGRGELKARVGSLDAGSELDRLGATIDHMAEALQRVRDEEQRIERTRRDLITAVSHDLRTPLANLRAMAEAIDERVVEDTDTFRRYAKEMQRSVAQLSSLVDDLFEFVQVDAVSIDGEVMALGDLVASAARTVRAEADRKGVRLLTDVRGVEGERCASPLVRVLQNLMVNAVRHTPAGGTIHVGAARTSTGLRIVVRDSGEGIAETDLPFVFDLFYRADAARSGDGAGLGLALADRLVRAMGGSITATSRPGEGATFSVALPATEEVTTGAPSGSARTRSDDRRVSGSRRPS